MSNDLHDFSYAFVESTARFLFPYIVLYCGGNTSAGSTLRQAGRIDSESIEPRLLLERAILPLWPSSTSGAYRTRPFLVSCRSRSRPATAALLTGLPFSIVGLLESEERCKAERTERRACKGEKNKGRTRASLEQLISLTVAAHSSQALPAEKGAHGKKTRGAIVASVTCGPCNQATRSSKMQYDKP